MEDGVSKYVSKGWHWYDVIATGTPEGIGPMQRGDVIEVEIEGIGTLKIRIV